MAVRRHPDADTLYVEDIDLGEDQPRQVVSGLVGKVPLEEYVGKRLVCVCNLKPANMRGVRSEAMVLAATSADGDKVRRGRARCCVVRMVDTCKLMGFRIHSAVARELCGLLACLPFLVTGVYLWICVSMSNCVCVLADLHTFVTFGATSIF